MREGAFSILSILSFVVVILLLSPTAFAEPRSQVVGFTCSDQIQHNSTAAITNFVAAMDGIRPQLEIQGYAIGNAGQGPDSVYALAQCYGDLSMVDCVLCYSVACNFIQCFPHVGEKLFLDGCFIRTDNYNHFHEYTGLGDRALCGNRTRKNSAFQETTRQAVLQAASYAPDNNGYAQVESLVSRLSNESVYVLANCWRTLNTNSCRACLEKASTSVLGCLPWSESRALNTGCFMRYSNTNFLNPIPSNSSSKGSPKIIIALVVSSVVVVAGPAVIGVYFWKHKRIQKKRKGTYDAKKLVKILRDSSMNFKYSILEKATGGFDEANKLGQGGFGAVYKGVLPDGREIAVKRLFFSNRHRVAELYNEVNIVSSVEHKNLTRLLGCSCSGPESLLVYEFLPNKSLDCFIFDPHKGKNLNWEKRFAIIIGTAKGLVYLHENTKIRIIHRDIKASNILLDRRFCAKIADFGLARSFQEDKSHISTVVAGTLGYMAPEYVSRGQLTEKADVYSFGVLLLEIVTGRQNNASTASEEYYRGLVTTAWIHFQQETMEEMIDPNLMLHNHHSITTQNEVLRVVHVGLLCTQEVPTLRPSMSQALQMLAKEDGVLPSPTNPPFINEESLYSNFIATISETVFYPR